MGSLRRRGPEPVEGQALGNRSPTPKALKGRNDVAASCRPFRARVLRPPIPGALPFDKLRAAPQAGSYEPFGLSSVSLCQSCRRLFLFRSGAALTFVSAVALLDLLGGALGGGFYRVRFLFALGLRFAGVFVFVFVVWHRWDPLVSPGPRQQRLSLGRQVRSSSISFFQAVKAWPFSV